MRQPSAQYWEDQLTRAGLSVCGEQSGPVTYLPQLALEALDSEPGGNYPDLKDIIEYKRDHMEVA